MKMAESINLHKIKRECHSLTNAGVLVETSHEEELTATRQWSRAMPAHNTQEDLHKQLETSSSPPWVKRLNALSREQSHASADAENYDFEQDEGSMPFSSIPSPPLNLASCADYSIEHLGTGQQSQIESVLLDGSRNLEVVHEKHIAPRPVRGAPMPDCLS